MIAEELQKMRHTTMVLRWLLILLCSHIGVNHELRFVEGIWLHRRSHQIRFFFRKLPILHDTSVTCSELPPFTSVPCIPHTIVGKAIHRRASIMQTSNAEN